METISTVCDFRQVRLLLRGETEFLQDSIRRWAKPRVLICVVTIVLGAGLYGAAMGAWRAPLQAFSTALKFPLVLLLTTLGNALLNGMLAPLLGLNIGFRQASLVILMSFTITSAILGSFSSLVFFITWNAPSISAPSGSSLLCYSFMQLTHVALIAYAGIMGNVRLVPLLQTLSGSASVARNVLFAWLASNLLLGSQICWVLRPFIGPPNLEVEFLSSHPLQGSLFETAFDAARQLLFH